MNHAFSMDETPAIDDPNLTVADVVVDSIDDRLLVALMAEAKLEHAEARRIADAIEAEVAETVRSEVGE
jgi:hypothetical protein